MRNQVVVTRYYVFLWHTECEQIKLKDMIMQYGGRDIFLTLSDIFQEMYPFSLQR